MQSPASRQDGGKDSLGQATPPIRAPCAHLDCRVGHAEVGANADCQEEVKNGWFDPGQGSQGSGEGVGLATPWLSCGPLNPGQ